MFTAKAESFLVKGEQLFSREHTQDLLKFFYMEKKRFYCKYILFCTFV